MTDIKQSVKSQGNTQDSLRAAVSHLDKQVQVLPSTLAKQLAQPTERPDTAPTTKSETATQQQKHEAQLPDVHEKQLTKWSEVLDDQPESDSVLAARATFMHQQQHVPLSRQLMEEPQKQVATAAPTPPEPSPKQPEQQPAASHSATPEPVPPQVTVVQVYCTNPLPLCMQCKFAKFDFQQQCIA